MKHNFYFTFGQQYSREAHPRFPDAHPDGWVRVAAENYDKARTYAFEHLFGPAFSIMYDESEFEKKWFPLGEISFFEI